MSDAERQRRRRKRLRRERNAELNKIAARKHADEQLRQYIPMPPGIVYYDLVEVTPDRPQEVWVPRGKPMARIAHNNRQHGGDCREF